MAFNWNLCVCSRCKWNACDSCIIRNCNVIFLLAIEFIRNILELSHCPSPGPMQTFVFTVNTRYGALYVRVSNYIDNVIYICTLLYFLYSFGWARWGSVYFTVYLFYAACADISRLFPLFFVLICANKWKISHKMYICLSLYIYIHIK